MHLLNYIKVKYRKAVVFCLLLTPLTAFTQQTATCTQTLKKAQKSYESGVIDNLKSLLEPCMNDGFSHEEKTQALKLITLSYLFGDSAEQADKSMLTLLKHDPDFAPNTVTDPIEFQKLYGTFRTKPLFSIGFKVGGNYTLINSAQTFGVGNTEQSPGSYKGSIGYQGAISADIHLNKKLTVNLDVVAASRSFTYTVPINGFSSLSSDESQFWVHVPLLVKYNFGQKKLKYFAELGGSLDDLLTSSSVLLRKDVLTQQNDAVGPSINLIAERHKLNYSGIIGGGLTYKAGYGYLILDVRYQVGLTNITNPSARYSNPQLVYTYGYISDDMALNALSISFGYMKSIYKPKKLNKTIVTE